MTMTYSDILKQKEIFSHDFPNFPDLDLITDISKEPYEREYCCNKAILFFPQSTPYTPNIVWDSDTIIDCTHTADTSTYADYKQTIKKIRKRLQSVTSIKSQNKSNYSCIFSEYDSTDSHYKIRGIIADDSINNIIDVVFYKVMFLGFMEWSISLNWNSSKNNKSIPHQIHLISFNKGEYKLHNNKDNTIKKITAHRDFKTLCKSVEIPPNDFKFILKNIHKQHTGTSFVMFADEDIACNESHRLASQTTGRGILLDHQNKCDIKHAPLLSSILDIDGGFILDNKLYCYAYACIFDGKVYQCTKDGEDLSREFIFEGMAAHGARHNSMKLYILNHNTGYTNDKQNKNRCIGVVFSEDGDITLFGWNDNKNKLITISSK